MSLNAGESEAPGFSGTCVTQCSSPFLEYRSLEASSGELRESDFPLRYRQREREQLRRDRSGNVAHIQLILHQKEKKVSEQEHGGS